MNSLLIVIVRIKLATFRLLPFFVFPNAWLQNFESFASSWYWTIHHSTPQGWQGCRSHCRSILIRALKSLLFRPINGCGLRTKISRILKILNLARVITNAKRRTLPSMVLANDAQFRVVDSRWTCRCWCMKWEVCWTYILEIEFTRRVCRLATLITHVFYDSLSLSVIQYILTKTK